MLIVLNYKQMLITMKPEKIIQRLSLDLRKEIPQTEGFSRTNLYYIKHWYEFFSSQDEFVHQVGE